MPAYRTTRSRSSLKAIVAEVTGDRRGPGGHILTGPVYVEGAEPGDALEVKVLSIDFAIDYGYNGCSGFLPENCDRAAGTKIVALDKKTMTAEFEPGIVVPLKPFFGSMGVAPAPEAGRVSSNPPGRHAGNMDNKELTAGSTLYIPVFVPGALFEIGDGHAAQGDGEVDQTAIETSLRGRLQLTVRKGMKLTWPRAETATDYISMGADPDLTVATRIAIQEMVDFVAATEEAVKASRVSARQHCRQRRGYAAGRQAERRRPCPITKKHLREVKRIDLLVDVDPFRHPFKVPLHLRALLLRFAQYVAAARIDVELDGLAHRLQRSVELPGA